MESVKQCDSGSQGVQSASINQHDLFAAQPIEEALEPHPVLLVLEDINPDEQSPQDALQVLCDIQRLMK